MLVAITAVSLLAFSCSSSQRVSHGYNRIPINSLAQPLSKDQARIRSAFGDPHVAWQKPLNTQRWVYCSHGSLVRFFDFDWNGAVIGQGDSGRSDLCGKLGTGCPEFAPEATGEDLQADRFDSLIESARLCFRQRHIPDMAIEALRKADEALQIKPSDFEANLLVTRTISYIATNRKPDQKRKWLAHRGYKIGKKLVKHYPKRVEGYYFAGVNLGLYAECMGTFAAVKANIKTKIENLMDQAIRLDSDFMQGAPLIAKARYLFRLPWPLCDRERATKIMLEVKRKFPKNLYVDLFFIDLAIEDNHTERARKLLEAMIRNLPAGTEDYAEGVTIRRQAIERLKVLDK